MKLIFMGTPDFSVPALDALVSEGETIVSVYTQPPRPAGRGKKSRPTPIHKRAEALGLPVRHPASLKSEAERRAFAELEADLAVVVAYGLILPRAVLSAPKLGCFNIHASLLPRWRGAAPIQRAILAGDTETGVCIMEMEPGLDTGPVRLRRTMPIGPTDTAGDLHDRLATEGAAAMVEVLRNLDRLAAIPQNPAGVTYAEKIDKSEARIDWTAPAEDVARRVNGLSPFPGAWCSLGNERLKLLRARPVAGDAAPGTHLGSFRIACGTGAIEVIEAQREGKRAMPAADVLRGFDLPARFG